MLSVPCPWCGERPEIEFRYGGDASVHRPDTAKPVSDEDWHAYLYVRDNPRGRQSEYWYHAHGCRRWFVAVRDTVSHAFGGSEDTGDVPPKDRP